MSSGAIVGSVLLVSVVGWFSTLVYLTVRAGRRASDGLANLRSEIRSANLGTDARYATALPGREQCVRELESCEDMAPLWAARLKELERAPLLSKLRKSWRTACNAIAFRTNLAAKGLQDAAFWAQFPPGSRAAESRFNNANAEDPDDLLREIGGD